MLNPSRMLVLTPFSSQNDENVLELDPETIVGWMGFPNSSMIYINGPVNHSVFTVKESVEEIKKRLTVLYNS